VQVGASNVSATFGPVDVMQLADITTVVRSAPFECEIYANKLPTPFQGGSSTCTTLVPNRYANSITSWTFNARGGVGSSVYACTGPSSTAFTITGFTSSSPNRPWIPNCASQAGSRVPVEMRGSGYIQVWISCRIDCFVKVNTERQSIQTSTPGGIARFFPGSMLQVRSQGCFWV
jgi:hypothetical protein